MMVTSTRISLPRNIPRQWLAIFGAGVRFDNGYAFHRVRKTYDGRYRVVATQLRYGPERIDWTAFYLVADGEQWRPLERDARGSPRRHRTARPAFRVIAAAMRSDRRRPARVVTHNRRADRG